MGILESPNFPGEYPAGAECHWRVRPNRNRRVLVIISSIHLDDSCGDVLTIRKTGTYRFYFDTLTLNLKCLLFKKGQNVEVQVFLPLIKNLHFLSDFAQTFRD